LKEKLQFKKDATSNAYECGDISMQAYN